MLRSLAETILREIQGFGAAPPEGVPGGICITAEVRRYESALIVCTLTGGKQCHAAQLLGMKATTLSSKMKRYGITV